MKRREMVEINVCDFCCGKDASWHRCMGCGKFLCVECQTRCSLIYEGRFDGGDRHVICIDCDSRLKTDHSDPLFNALLNMVSLRQENETFQINMKERWTVLESLIISLRGARDRHETMEAFAKAHDFDGYKVLMASRGHR